MGKQRRVELKSVGNFVAKTALLESANQFSLEELCRTKYSLKYFIRSHVDHQTYGKTLKNPTKCLHLCAVTYMTEISLIVTLNNPIHHQYSPMKAPRGGGCKSRMCPTYPHLVVIGD